MRYVIVSESILQVRSFQFSTFFGGTYQACAGKDFPEKWCIRCNLLLQGFEALNEIGIYSVRICGVGTEHLQEMGLADAHNLREPPAPDGERLWDAIDHPNFPCHAVRSCSHHELKEGTRLIRIESQLMTLNSSLGIEWFTLSVPSSVVVSTS